ncbi:OprD family porin [Pseudomonas sp. CAU 1711]|uniref:OprD family porin n=1 Tax=Pseudomonas sp. CAU 1711 TaxID=3140356 RepID=UPI003261BD22
MQVMKWSALALAVTAASTQLAFASAQSESNGIVEDSSFKIFNRALYMNRDFKHGATHESEANEAKGERKGYREDFGLGIRLLFESGFTQGTVGVGVDAHSLSSIKLDTGAGRQGNGLFGVDSDGTAEDTQSEVGGAIKFRVSNTVLKHGNMMLDTPVFSTDDSRILPEVATGTLLTSDEISGLTLTAGRFTALSSQTAAGRDTVTSEDSDENLHTLTSANIFGANYAFTDDFSGALFFSDVEDHFKKTYLNLNYGQDLGNDQSFGLDFNFYRTTDDGKKFSGELDNRIWSIAPSYGFGGHKVTIAYQRSSGDTGYTYGIDGGGAVYLNNSVQIGDYELQDEKSWQARYDLNMAEYGVPGLSFMTRYVTSDDIDGVRADGKEGKRHELNMESKYVIQEGAAKDLSFRVRHAVYRANFGRDLNDTRLIIEYPLDVL